MSQQWKGNPVCKDCYPKLEGLAGYVASGGVPRPAPHPGPRCATHHRVAVKAARKRAHDTRVQAVYGLREGEYDQLYESQGGRCALCRRATGKVKRLAVDHDHETQEVRGLLCGVCNHDIIGHGRDDPEFFDRCADYLRNPPARKVLNREAELPDPQLGDDDQ